MDTKATPATHIILSQKEVLFLFIYSCQSYHSIKYSNHKIITIKLYILLLLLSIIVYLLNVPCFSSYSHQYIYIFYSYIILHFYIIYTYRQINTSKYIHTYTLLSCTHHITLSNHCRKILDTWVTMRFYIYAEQMDKLGLFFDLVNGHAGLRKTKPILTYTSKTIYKLIVVIRLCSSLNSYLICTGCLNQIVTQSVGLNIILHNND